MDAPKSLNSNNEALMHMVKATIGGGFLAMPEAFHNIGIVMGVVGTIILGLSVLNMMSCIVSTHLKLIRADETQTEMIIRVYFYA